MTLKTLESTGQVSSEAGDSALRLRSSRSVEMRLVPMPMRLPLSVRNRVQAAARRQGLTCSALARRLIESSLREAPDGPSNEPAELTKQALHSRRVEVRLALEDARKADVFASRAGIKRAGALAELVHLGLEADEERNGIPGSRVEAVLSVLSSVETLLSRIGSTVLGILVLNAYSVALAGQGRVSEEELLAQAKSVGEDEWQRILDELRHEGKG